MNTKFISLATGAVRVLGLLAPISFEILSM